MKLNEYQTLALRTEKPLSTEMRLMHAAMGIGSEAGELLTAIKAHVIYGKPLDGENVREELGDLLWYMSQMAAILDTPMSEVAEENLKKLRKRYPDRYTDALAIARLDKE